MRHRLEDMITRLPYRPEDWHGAQRWRRPAVVQGARAGHNEGGWCFASPRGRALFALSTARLFISPLVVALKEHSFER